MRRSVTCTKRFGVRRAISAWTCAVVAVLCTFTSVAQKPARPELQWFADAKLGIFIHWGIYSVNGTDESWAFYNKKMPYADYMKQISGFTAKNYDPAVWADLIAKSGARYAVITTKHHDGVAMYDTRSPSLASNIAPRSSIVNGAPAKHDAIAPLFDELRERSIKCGAYYSLIDWSDYNYPAFTKDSSRYAIKDDPARWQRFREFYQSQINEIATILNPDLWWFDGDWEHSAEEWEAAKVRAMILEKNPMAIINGRLQGYGDYATPEQNIPVETPKAEAWELCMTIGDQWGWQPQDTNYKSTHDLIAIFADVVGHGGNLLLDIGPKEDGTIPPGQVKVLEEIGQWNAKHGEAIFGTRAGLPNGHFFGPSTLSADSTTLYLFLPHGVGGSAEIKGLDNKILSVEVLRDAGSGPGMKLNHRVVGKISWSKVPGLVFIDVPDPGSGTGMAADPWMTVLKVKLDGKVKLYRGQGGF
ncbi:MAG: alpha-L-fucosidase [Flavobacteriales bacterium]|nr:alpha-L-fucosidase [Flavobacteriales bacterium]